jgi:hypothetical protein
LPPLTQFISPYSGKDEVVPEENVSIQPSPVVREANGWWHHQNLPVFDEDQGEE